MPTPYVAFQTTRGNFAAGVMVTASHNPKDDNGYKVYWGNGCQVRISCSPCVCFGGEGRWGLECPAFGCVVGTLDASTITYFILFFSRWPRSSPLMTLASLARFWKTWRRGRESTSARLLFAVSFV